MHYKDFPRMSSGVDVLLFHSCIQHQASDCGTTTGLILGNEVPGPS
jgi:hypothetical protein